MVSRFQNLMKHFYRTKTLLSGCKADVAVDRGGNEQSMIQIMENLLYSVLWGSMILLVVLAIRPMLKKKSNRIVCVLWLLVMFRFLCPVAVKIPMPWFHNAASNATDSISGIKSQEKLHNAQANREEQNKELTGITDQTISVNSEYRSNQSSRKDMAAFTDSINSMEAKKTMDSVKKLKRMDQTDPADSMALVDQAEFSNQSNRMDRTDSSGLMDPFETEEQKNPDVVDSESQVSFVFLKIFGVVWLLGTIIVLMVGIRKYWIIKRTLREAIYIDKWENYPVKISDASGVPLAFGILKREIYVPISFEEAKEGVKDTFTQKQRELILWHEAMHLRRLDPLRKVMAYVMVAVHWWNPIVWICVKLMDQDIEMACDEAVLEQVGQKGKKEYARTLLSFAERHSGPTLIASFGESDAESRIKNALSYRKASTWMNALMLLPVLILGGCLALNPTVSAMEGQENTKDSKKDDSLDEVSSNDINFGKDQLNKISEVSNDEKKSEIRDVIVINEMNFPDPIFREYVKSNFDINGNGSFEPEELNKVREINCYKMGIESVKGVEFFTELESLECSNNHLSSMDVSKNKDLFQLLCSENEIRKLDISNCPRLLRARDLEYKTEENGHITYGEIGAYILDFDKEVEVFPKMDVEIDLNSTFTEEEVQKYWKCIYANILQDAEFNGNDGIPPSYCRLIYLNDDQLPELVLNRWSVYRVYTILNGKISTATLYGNGCSFKERGNMICSSGGRMGAYDNEIWTIGEAGFELLHDGEYNVYSWDENNQPEIAEYFMDGKKLSEEEYYNVINELIPEQEKEEIYADESCGYYEMIRYLREYSSKNNYKEAFAEWLKSEKYTDKLKEFALIDRDGTSPLLIGVGDEEFWTVTYYDGFLVDHYWGHVSNDSEEVFVYPDQGVVARYSFENRYDRYASDVEDTYDQVDLWTESGIEIKRKSKELLQDYLRELKGKRRIKITLYGTENAGVTYLSAEQMLKVLTK